MANDWYNREDFHVEADPPSAIKAYVAVTRDTTGEIRRHFCGQCGSPLYITTEKNPDFVTVPRGTNDGKHGRDHALNAGNGWEGEVIAGQPGAESGDQIWKPEIEIYCSRRMGSLPKIEGAKTLKGMPEL
ncbi:hypothetical protein MMC10_001080 [Thelotrema lepadinum]|nr:hypothetical protein [Thelotrema lepadinum]